MHLSKGKTIDDINQQKLGMKNNIGNKFWNNILFEVNFTSKLLQNKEADLKSATSQLQVTKNYLVGIRCDEGLQQVLTDTTEIAKELEILPHFETKQV